MHHLPELNDARLYDLLEGCGKQACASARLLARFVEEGGQTPAVLAEPVQLSAKLADELRARLHDAIISSLPKADIESLSLAMAGIPTAAERFAARFSLAKGSL